MRLRGREIETFLNSPEVPVSAVLIYGPDLGLVRERGSLLQGKVVEDASDPFRIAEFSAGELRQDPAKLADEVAAVAMLGGQRVVRLRDGSDAVTKVFEAFFNDPIGDALIILEAGDLPARSSLRKLFEGAGNAAALPCYEDEGQILEAVIAETLGRHGLKADPQARRFLSEALGTDRMVTRGELEKLALYMIDNGVDKGVDDGVDQKPGQESGEEQTREISLEDAEAAIGDRGVMAIDTLINAVASGDTARMNEGLQTAYVAGAQPVQILRGLVRHYGRLQLVAAEMGEGRAADQAMTALRPPVFFKYQSSFRAQLQRWTLKRINTALALLMEAELHCKTTGYPDRTICSRACLRLAVMGQT